MQDYLTTPVQTDREEKHASKIKIDLRRYMGWGKKMFPDIDAQDYIRELRDCDRTF